jgi:indole-3-glycerol phosphate synthase
MTKEAGPMNPKVEVETISEREHALKVDGEIIGVSKTQYDALFHKHFLDRKFDEAFKAGQVSMKVGT